MRSKFFDLHLITLQLVDILHFKTFLRMLYVTKFLRSKVTSCSAGNENKTFSTIGGHFCLKREPCLCFNYLNFAVKCGESSP